MNEDPTALAILADLERRLNLMSIDAVVKDWKWWRPFRSGARADALSEVATMAFEALIMAKHGEDVTGQ